LGMGIVATVGAPTPRLIQPDRGRRSGHARAHHSPFENDAMDDALGYHARRMPSR